MSKQARLEKQGRRSDRASDIAIESAEIKARQFIDLHDFVSERSDDDSSLKVLAPAARSFLKSKAGRAAGPLWADSYEKMRWFMEAFLNRREAAVVTVRDCQEIEIDVHLSIDFASRRFGHLYLEETVAELRSAEKANTFEGIVEGLDLGPDLA